MYLWESDSLPTGVWQTLAETERPILVYGMGNGADKLAERLALLGKTVDAYFASDGFVRGQTFRAQTVLSRSEALSRFADPIVLLAFASNRPEVLSMLYAVDGECDLYMPDLPVSGEEYFDVPFYLRHRTEIRRLADLLADEESRRTLDAVLRYKLTGRIGYLRKTGEGKADLSGILHPDGYRRALDGGAYSGDTASALLDVAPNLLEIVAVEPDRRNYKRLCRYAEGETRARVTPMHAALLDGVGEALFSVSGNRNATLGAGSYGAKQESVPTVSVDSVGAGFDFIKLDVEGAERDALLGAVKTVAECRPELLVSVYHRSEDLFALPHLLSELCPDYRFYLRRDECLPAWERNLLAVPCEHCI